MIVFYAALVCAAQADSILEPEKVADSVSLKALGTMDTLANVSDGHYKVSVLQPPPPKGDTDAGRGLFIALQTLGERVEDVYRLRDLANPKVERIELGQLTFKMTLSYGFNIGKKQVSATLQLDRIADKKD